MNAIAAPKSRIMNWLEGISLSAVIQGLPSLTAAALVLKLMGSSHAVGGIGGTAIFVLAGSILYAVLAPGLAAKFPGFFGHTYQPIFFDPGLSFSEKILRWRKLPATSLQVLTRLALLLALAAAVLMVG